MALKESPKKRQKMRRRAAQAVRGGLTRLKRRVAPAPTPAAKPLPLGVLRPDPEKTRSAGEWVDSHQLPAEEATRVVRVIVLLACLWMAIIAWFISQMEP